MRILIVEDEEKLARGLKRTVEKAGYAADYVLDGDEGERRITMAEHEYDLVILDLNLPKKDGFEICKQARERGITTPILVLSGRGAVEDKVYALDRGADDYLIKPFSGEELLARVRALMRRPEQPLPVKLTVRDLQLNTATREVFRNGRPVQLTLKEYSLLEYLMRHPNQVLNRDQIFDHLWDFASNTLSNVVDVHMKNLRMKIDNQPGEKLLETIRGVGYRIRD